MSPLEKVEAFLSKKGGALVAGSAIPERIAAHIGDKCAAVFRIPQKTQHGNLLFIVIPETFPHAIPEFFLGEGYEGSPIPHVSASGHICLFQDQMMINPDYPDGVVEDCIVRAVEVLNIPNGSQEFKDQLVAEITPYWILKPWVVTKNSEVLHFNPEHFIPSTAVPLQSENRGIHKIWNSINPTNSSTKGEGILLVLDLSEEQCLALIKNPKGVLCDPKIMANAERQLNEFLYQHTDNAKERAKVLVMFRLLDQDPKKSIYLSALFSHPLHPPTRYKMTHEVRVKKAMKRLIEKANLEPIPCENLSFERLFHRAAGLDKSEDFRKLQNIRLALLGCGAIGGYLADMLVRAGIQKMLLADKDFLLPENRARHILAPTTSEYFPKSIAMGGDIVSRFPDIECFPVICDLLTDNGLERVINWRPTIIVSAVALPNVNFRISELLRNGKCSPAIFVWVEPELKAGHVVYQPRREQNGYRELYEDPDPNKNWAYRHRVVENPEDFILSERGCQATFTPFSPIDLSLFVAQAARKIISLMINMPQQTECYRGLPETGYTMEKV